MIFDYTGITADSIRADAEAVIAEATAVADRIAAEPPSWETTMMGLEDITDMTGRAFGRTAFMGYVHPDEDVRNAGKELEERLSKFGIELVFRSDLYEAVKAYAESDDGKARTGAEARLIEFTMRDFEQAGHGLDGASQARLQDLSNRLVELGVRFEQNIAEHDDALIVTKDDLEGMPEAYIETLEPGDDQGTWKVTMAYPHVVPFFENNPRRDLRKELSDKFNNRAVEANRPILEEAVGVRKEIARIFDLDSWAHRILDDRMAADPANVAAFYADIRGPLTESGSTEKEPMAALLEADTGDAELRSYDMSYYETQIRRREYGVDPNAVAEYLPLDSVLEGLFRITAEVFGLSYEELDVEVWHPDVRTFAIHDAADGRLISHFSMDLFPRVGKFSHAAAFPLVSGRRLADGSYQTPYSAIVANFTKPTASRPSLLQHGEVETFFHEFGHILHQTLTTSELVRFAGTNVERDFVEAPSQIMEHWTWRADVLSTFARHHETGEPIPSELVDQLVAARRLNIALSKLRQMTYGMLDQELHGPAEEKDLDEILRRIWAVSMFPVNEGTFFMASWGHLFGYDAGYYGYLWSEVYGDDMFSRFEDEGVLSPEVGADYRREILEAGGTRDAMDHLRAFLGRDPNSDAFLRKLGIGS